MQIITLECSSDFTCYGAACACQSSQSIKDILCRIAQHLTLALGIAIALLLIALPLGGIPRLAVLVAYCLLSSLLAC